MKTIAIDIDDVLAANAEGFIEFSNKRWGTRLKPEDFSEHWAEMWGVDHEELLCRRKQVIESKIHMTFRFFDDAKPVLERLARDYKLVTVSSRTMYIAKDTTEWIKNNYGSLFSENHYAKIWDDLEKPVEEKIHLTKTETLREVGADYLIDDQPKHCIAAAEAGIEALLFGNYRWNRDIKLTEKMARVKDWQAVMEYFDAKSWRGF